MKRWQEIYKQKLCSADEAVKLVQNRDNIVAPLSNGQPPSLANALAKRLVAENMNGITYIAGVDARWFDIYQPEMQGHILIDTGFVGPATRHWVGQGMFTYTPCRLGETVDMATKCRNVDVVTMVVSPMDEHGFFSTGCNVDLGWEAAKTGDPRNIIVEVNENMPRTFGTNHIHVTQVSAVVENHIPLVELPEIPLCKEDEAIGHYVADMIPDGACVQIGIGGMPNAIANFLHHKKDLGVHSEMLTDTMVDLYYDGVITCEKKNFNRFKWIGSFALGTRKLYDFINNNPMVEMHSTKYVNDPYVIGQNDNMISVNATLEVDLSGQAASESLGVTQYSGTGGQLDFVQGAWRSNGGKSFLTMYSTYTTKEGEMKSKILPTLSPGIFTTVSRTEVQYVVTEYGVAYLKGQNLRTRVKELVNIAHPDFRDWLLFEARKLNYIP
ncbi:MAG: acetyl-CoA hydrolase/transferase family protein [Candidatus Saccharibacteria bacterium]